MFDERKLKHIINKIHENSLSPTYSHNTSTLRERLCKDDSLTIHHRNLLSLAIEFDKVIISQILLLRLLRKYLSKMNAQII